MKQKDLKEQAAPAIYQPYQQVKRPMFLRRMTFVVGDAGRPRRIAPAMRAALRERDDDLAAQSIASMEDIIGGTIAEPRFQTRYPALESEDLPVVASFRICVIRVP